MKKKHAWQIARQHVAEIKELVPGYQCALFSGSTVYLDPEDEILPGSDVDVLIVVEDDSPTPRDKSGMTIIDGALIELNFCPLSWFKYENKEGMLTEPNFASNLATEGFILDDPEGLLFKLSKFIQKNFARQSVVISRCAKLLDRIQTRAFNMMTQSDNLYLRMVGHENVVTGLAQLFLLANLENPTHKRSLVKAKSIMSTNRYAESYPLILEILGANNMTNNDVMSWYSYCLKSYFKEGHNTAIGCQMLF